jgi:predicted ABC-type exoprotein transport system permease subunit
MKKYFSSQNIVSFVLVTLACAASILIVIPLARKFVPGLKKTTTTTTASPVTTA